MWTCKVSTWHIVCCASHAKGSHFLTRCYKVKEGETKSGGQGGGNNNKNTKSDNQKGTTESLHQRTATRNCRVHLSSPSESSRFTSSQSQRNNNRRQRQTKCTKNGWLTQYSQKDLSMQIKRGKLTDFKKHTARQERLIPTVVSQPCLTRTAQSSCFITVDKIRFSKKCRATRCLFGQQLFAFSLLSNRFWFQKRS